MSDCDAVRTLLHERLDGLLAEADSRALDEHLAACADCRSAAQGLAAVRSGLRALPEHPLPGAALEAILDRTARSRRPAVRLGAIWPAWAGAVALAALALLLLRRAPPPAAPSGIPAAEVARAASEARVVLSLASGALQRAERVAGGRVLAGEVAPALNRIPIRWAPRPEPRKS